MNELQGRIVGRISTIEKQLTALGRDCLTNTYKRQRQQLHRDKEAEKLRMEKYVLEFLAEEAGVRELTTVEKALTSTPFYQDIRAFHSHVQRLRTDGSKGELTFPAFEETAARLRKNGISDVVELRAAVARFEKLLELATIPVDPNLRRIKELTFKARLQQGGDIQFTPVELANELIQLAGISENSRVLEPEAAIGYIADEVRKITPNVDCVEINYGFRELLELKGHSIIGTDFLEKETRPVYDAVIMNPPFSDECRHIQHAYEFLKPGGVLVSVCSSCMESPKGRRYEEFYAWLAGLDFHFRRLSAKFEATSTNTRVLVIRK